MVHWEQGYYLLPSAMIQAATLRLNAWLQAADCSFPAAMIQAATLRSNAWFQAADCCF